MRSGASWDDVAWRVHVETVGLVQRTDGLLADLRNGPYGFAQDDAEDVLDEMFLLYEMGSDDAG